VLRVVCVRARVRVFVSVCAIACARHPRASPSDRRGKDKEHIVRESERKEGEEEEEEGGHRSDEAFRRGTRNLV
jgi:hypothetical protein